MAYPLADAGNAIPSKITDPIRFIGEESDRPGEISAMISGRRAQVQRIRPRPAPHAGDSGDAFSSRRR